MTDDRAFGVFVTALADAIIDLDDWPDVTADAFLERLERLLDGPYREESEDLEFLVEAARRLHGILLRAYDLHRNTKAKAPPRGTSH